MQPKPSPLKTATNPIPAGARSLALAGLLSFAAAAPGLADFVSLPENTPETPGVALDGGTGNFAGTVIAAQDSLFNLQTTFAGILRTMVVDTGLGYDFYYQIVNTGTDDGGGADIFRMKTLGGFDGLTLSVTYRTDLNLLNFGAFASGPAGGAGAYEVGTKSVFSADRDVNTAGSAGFDFSPSQFLLDPANVNPGEKSLFAVVRTSANAYLAASMDISGTDTARIATYAPVPEPRVAALFALGSVLLLRRRSSRW